MNTYFVLTFSLIDLYGKCQLIEENIVEEYKSLAQRYENDTYQEYEKKLKENMKDEIYPVFLERINLIIKKLKHDFKEEYLINETDHIEYFETKFSGLKQTYIDKFLEKV